MAVIFVFCLGGGCFALGQEQWNLFGLEGTAVYALTMDNEGNLCAATDTGICRYHEGIKQWLPVFGAQGGTVYSLLNHHGTLFAAGWNGGVVSSSDGGMSFLQYTNDVSGLTVYCLASLGDLLFAGTEYGVFRSSDHAVTWQFIESDSVIPPIGTLIAVGTRIYAFGYRSSYSDDNGQSWHSVEVEKNEWLDPIRAGSVISATTVSSANVVQSGSVPDVSQVPMQNVYATLLHEGVVYMATEGGVFIAKPLSLAPTTQPIFTTRALPAYPNPSNPDVWIPFEIKESASVVITIYSLNGAIVRQLDIGVKESGVYATKTRAAYWDGTNTHGERVASGLYVYEIRLGMYRFLRRILVQR